MTDLLTMYDAVAVDTIPANAEVLLGYTDVRDAAGTPIYNVMRSTFPNATVLSITTTGQPGADECDMEWLDLDPAEAAQWAANEIHSGRPSWDPPCIYCQSSNGLAVLQACDRLGLTLGALGAKGTQVVWHGAWWNGVPDLAMPPPPWPQLPEPVAHQYLRQGPYTYDISVALRAWVYPAPPAPPPIKKEADSMFVRNPGPATVGLVAAGGICLCSPSGAVNLGNSWPKIVADYENVNEPLILHNDAVLLKLFVGIAYHPYPPA